MENVVEIRRRWRVEFGTQPPTRVTITRIRDKFEVDGYIYIYRFVNDFELTSKYMFINNK